MAALLFAIVIFSPAIANAACNVCTTQTETITEPCACGQTGNITKQRTANPGGVCDTYTAWTETSNTCSSPSNPVMVDSYVRLVWQALPDSDNAKFNTPSGRMINNCPSGWTQTEIRDDSDSKHSLSEDDGSGTRRQLCLMAPGATILYDWVPTSQACPANTTNTETYDNYGGSTNKTSKHYLYYHYMSEEDDPVNDYWKFCLGVEPPATMTHRWAVGGCAANETALYKRHGNEDNMNNEDGADNRTLCVNVKVQAQTSENCGAAAPSCGGDEYTCTAGTPGNQGSGGGMSTWTCTLDTQTVNCSYDDGGWQPCQGGFCPAEP